jgi:ribosomal protein S18 acetylase RimI-like enzyme
MSIDTQPFTIEERLPSAAEFNTLIQAVGWQGYFNLEVTATALQNSLYGVVAKTGNSVIGMCRIVGDGAINYYLQDLVVLPAYQRRGVGTQLMDRMMAYLYQHAPDNAYVGLFAVKGTQAFYRQYGFQGPDGFLYGMARKIRLPPAVPG